MNHNYLKNFARIKQKTTYENFETLHLKKICEKCSRKLARNQDMSFFTTKIIIETHISEPKKSILVNFLNK